MGVYHLSYGNTCMGVKVVIQENKPIIYAKTSEGFDDSLNI